MYFSEILGSMSGAGSQFRLAVGDDWLQGRATFGGLVAAAGNEAMRRLVPRDRPLRSLQTTFVGPANPGTWTLNVRVLRVGKAVTLAQCEVVDAKQVVAAQIGVYGAARASAISVQPEVQPAPRAVDDTDIDAAKEGYVNQTGLLQDPNGRPVALSRQLFAVFG